VTTVSLKLEYFGISDVGLVRTNNEDVWSVIPGKQFFILADGMGGHKAGEVAASFAVESMCASIEALPNSANVEDVCQFLRRAIDKANSRVFEESHRHVDFAGMGTTLSCFIVLGKCLVYGHVGDSRLYRFRKKLVQLTEDHSLRQTVGNREDPANLFLRNVITRAIGTQLLVYPDVGVIPFQSKDLYMLCSDGLTDYVDNAKISSVLSSSIPLEEMGKNLVSLALEKGGNDNITLLLVRIM
jgi:serine/threonine protein phosphatase PrpC